ncbi:MAG TPA: hypothetical protein VM618_10910 [Acidimicrobiia bacterium]|nr:hypothetical protein [Acidimicrobiia bacterium]
MTRPVAMFVMVVVAIVAMALALAVSSAGAAPEEAAGGRWGCAGVEPVIGVCLDSPIETLRTGLL